MAAGRLFRKLILLSASLALFAASEAAAQDAEDNRYQPPKQMTVSPLGVDLQSGKFSHQVTDLSIGPLTLTRSYLGGHTVYGNAHFGLNWSHNHSIYAYQKDLLNKLGNTLVVIGGKTFSFTRTATGIYWDGPTAEGTFLEGADGAFVFTDQQGDVYTFNPFAKALPAEGLDNSWPNQRIARIDHANGHRVTYSYSGTGYGARLTEIASNYGYAIVFEYAPNGYISRACGYNRGDTAAASCTGAKLAVSYSYPDAGWINLKSVTDAAGQAWGYDYAGTSNVGQLTCVRKVNASDCLIRNVYAGERPRHVTQQTAADGSVWNYHYVLPDRDYDLNASHGIRETTGSSYRDPEGNTVAVEFYSGQLKRYYEHGNMDDPAWNLSNSRVTELEWNGLELAKLTHKEGNSVTYARRGELVLSETWTPKPGSGLAPVFTASRYPDRGADGNSNFCAPEVGRKRCNKPLWTEDFNRNRTEYSYDERHGGVLTETGPAVNGVKPQKRYTYVQRVAAAAPAGPAIWLVETMSYCRTGNPAPGGGCAAAGDEVVTRFDYEPKNLNLRSETVTADGASRRTCYGYDWQGNRISTTRPSGSCS